MKDEEEEEKIDEPVEEEEEEEEEEGLIAPLSRFYPSLGGRNVETGWVNSFPGATDPVRPFP